jgi:CspA family cold shock protein
MFMMILEEMTSSDDLPKRITGSVKWFDPARSYGFIVAEGFEKDFLLHESKLWNFGRSNVQEGATIEFEYERSEFGYRITKVCAVGPSGQSGVTPVQLEVDPLSQTFVPARVKWFDMTKGFGFVQIFGQEKDVFIGRNILERAGISDVRQGQALSVQIADNDGQRCVFDVCEWI